MIVVDTNVVGYLFLTSDKSELAELALQKDPNWAAPLLWRSELRNVLALYLKQNRLSLSEAGQIMVKATELMRSREYTVNSAHVLRLVATSDCSAYDCEFVAVAEDLGVKLITVDQKLLRQFPLVTRSLVEYCSVT